MDEVKNVMEELKKLEKRITSVEKEQSKNVSKFKTVMKTIKLLIGRINSNESDIRRNSTKR